MGATNLTSVFQKLIFYVHDRCRITNSLSTTDYVTNPAGNKETYC
jgi:hypothetical protein